MTTAMLPCSGSPRSVRAAAEPGGRHEPRWWLGFIVLLSFLIGIRSLAAQVPGSLDTGFPDAVSTQANATALAVQADGKIVLGGDFTQVGGLRRSRIARLNPDGSLDPSFNADSSGAIYDVAVQADGRILLGGGFNQINGDTRNHVARLNADGSLDEGFGGDVQGYVNSVAVQADGKILLGGFFDQIDGLTRYGVARLLADGSLDAGFNAAARADNNVKCVAVQADGKILLGGAFTQINGSRRNLIARLNANGSLDAGFLGQATGDGGIALVRAIAVQADGKILLGGAFIQVNGVGQMGVARLNRDGSLDAGFDAGFSAGFPGRVVVASIAVQNDGGIILGGLLSPDSGYTSYFVVRLNADGSLDPGFAASVNGDVFRVVVQTDGQVLLGGGFTLVNGAARNALVRLNGDTPPAVSRPMVSVVGAASRGGFVLSRTGDLSASASVAYHSGGSALQGLDYVAFPGSLTIAAGQSEAVLPVPLLIGANRNRKVKVFLDPAPNEEYGIAKAQSKVFLSDLP